MTNVTTYFNELCLRTLLTRQRCVANRYAKQLIISVFCTLFKCLGELDH